MALADDRKMFSWEVMPGLGEAGVPLLCVRLFLLLHASFLGPVARQSLPLATLCRVMWILRHVFLGIATNQCAQASSDVECTRSCINSNSNRVMTQAAQQVVFLCLVGTTPAVLTETVYALANQDEALIPDRLVAVTTSTGKKLLIEKLFDGGHWEALKTSLRVAGQKVEGKLLFGPVADSIRVFPNAERNRELDDIRTLEDNETVAEFFMELVRSFTENDSIRLVTSLAGGRKTTSALLHSVMTLLGRSQDVITHILVNDRGL
jgi:CRISPR-associated protein (TIGR02584 family)